MSENGVILQSFDLGVTWSVTEILNAKILDFTIADEDNMFIVFMNGDIINYHNKDKFDRVYVNYRDSEDKVIATKIDFRIHFKWLFLGHKMVISGKLQMVEKHFRLLKSQRELLI